MDWRSRRKAAMTVIVPLLALCIPIGATPLDRACFRPPPEWAGELGDYRSPLKCNNGTIVETAADWQRRRQEILETWYRYLGTWPPLIDTPQVRYLERASRGDLIQQEVSVEIAPGQQSVDGYLLSPDRSGPLPAVLVVYYDAETGAGLGKEGRDFAYQLAQRGFVTLSIGTPGFCSLKSPYKPLCEAAEAKPPLQPLSALAYVAANCHTALANMALVDGERIGIVGHSYGGKWAMFASCLYEKFACAVWSDPGIVFDESRPNINYWEPWYLGYDPDVQRQRGIPNAENPRTGAYRKLLAAGHDLHELHALMAPRPFLVSGGAEDPPKRWQALNHTVAVNRTLGYADRVAMTNRPSHGPTPESNAQIYAFFERFLKAREGERPTELKGSGTLAPAAHQPPARVGRAPVCPLACPIAKRCLTPLIRMML
jgi:dienelactone hydrolase